MMRRVSFGYVFWMSRFLLALERACVSFWPLVTLAMLAAALSGFGVLRLLPAWLHIATLAAMAGASVWLALRPRVPFSLPSRREVLRAIESQSRLPHAPLQLLDDTLPVGMNDDKNDKAAVFWTHERRRAADAIRHRLNIYRPWPAIAGQDPHGLRHAVALLFILFAVTAQGAAADRIYGGLWPDAGRNGNGAKTPSLEAWITAPDYTGRPPVILAAPRGAEKHDSITMPEGSILHVRASGYRIAPVIRANGGRLALETGKDGAMTIDAPLTRSAALSVRHLISFIAATQVDIIPDTPPELQLHSVDKAHTGAMRLSYAAKDDYAVTRLYGTLAAADRKGYVTEYHFDMPAPSQSSAQLTSLQDFSALPVAGSMATLTLTAEDAAGHVVSTPPVQVAIPERQFTNAVAGAMAFERKRLLAFDNAITRKLSVYALMEAARFPAHYKGDPVVYMGLVSAIKRLAYDRDNTSVDSVAPLLWDLAIRVEDGGLIAATTDATNALAQLQKTLADKNATQAEIAAAMEAAQRAMNAYMQAFAREMLQRVQQGQKPMVLSPELSAKLSQRIDMNAMSSAMEMMRMMNDRNAMQKLAQQMQDALQNLDLNKMNQMDRRTQASLQALDALYPLINDQRALRDITQLAEPGKADPRMPQAQDKLTARLDDIVKGLGAALDVPAALGDARDSMADSSAKLSSGDTIAAATAQDAAIDALQKAFDAASNQMAAAMKQQMLFMPGFGAARPDGRTDPFGRGMGSTTESDVVLPDHEEQRRVQKIIRDLRDRANDGNKPKVERDYINRLLDIMN